jgi:hypothetical protein
MTAPIPPLVKADLETRLGHPAHAVSLGHVLLGPDGFGDVGGDGLGYSSGCRLGNGVRLPSDVPGLRLIGKWAVV